MDFDWAKIKEFAIFMMVWDIGRIFVIAFLTAYVTKRFFKK